MAKRVGRYDSGNGGDIVVVVVVAAAVPAVSAVLEQSKV